MEGSLRTKTPYAPVEVEPADIDAQLIAHNVPRAIPIEDRVNSGPVQSPSIIVVVIPHVARTSTGDRLVFYMSPFESNLDLVGSTQQVIIEIGAVQRELPVRPLGHEPRK